MNPGHLAKGKEGGTYAVVTFDPTKMDMVDSEMVENRARERIRVDIINI